MKLSKIPQEGQYYYFFDDGKICMSRCYKAFVNKVLPSNFEDKNIYNISRGGKIINLFDILSQSVNRHRQSKNFIVLNTPNIEPGQPYLYAEKTDYFIECLIPDYDDNSIWFTRDVNGGWFSMDIDSGWSGGILDVDFELYKEMKLMYSKDGIDIDESLKEDELYININ